MLKDQVSSSSLSMTVDDAKREVLRRLDLVDEFSVEEKEVVKVGFWYIDHATFFELVSIEDPSSFAHALQQKYLKPGQRLSHMITHISDMMKYSARLSKLREQEPQRPDVTEPSILTRRMRSSKKMCLRAGHGIDEWAWEEEERRQAKAIRDMYRDVEIDSYLFPGQWKVLDGDFVYSPTLEELPQELPFQTYVDVKQVERWKKVYRDNKESWHAAGCFVISHISPFVMRDIVNQAFDLTEEEMRLSSL